MKERTGGRTAAANFPSVSVLMPARDAAATIAVALDSVLSQEYGGPVEVIVADGSGSPAMSELIRRRYPTVPDGEAGPQPRSGTSSRHRQVSSDGDGGDRALRRPCVLPPGYLRRAVESLRGTGAANVGGRRRPVGTTFFTRAVAMAMITPLGTGYARYRIGGPAGPVDTVYPGVFRREALDAVGLLVLGLVASGFLALAGAPWVAASALPLVYVLVLAIGSLAVVGLRRRSYAALLLPVVLATMHLAWGLGFFLPFRRLRWGNRVHQESRPRECGENGVAGPRNALRRTPDDAEALE